MHYCNLVDEQRIRSNRLTAVLLHDNVNHEIDQFSIAQVQTGSLPPTGGSCVILSAVVQVYLIINKIV